MSQRERLSRWHSWTHATEDLILEVMDDGGWWFVLDLGQAIRRPSGTLYPALTRMEKQQPPLIEFRWQTPAEMQPGQELRRGMRRLTQDGQRELARRRKPARRGWLKPRTVSQPWA